MTTPHGNPTREVKRRALTLFVILVALAVGAIYAMPPLSQVLVGAAFRPFAATYALRAHEMRDYARFTASIATDVRCPAKPNTRACRKLKMLRRLQLGTATFYDALAAEASNGRGLP